MDAPWPQVCAFTTLTSLKIRLIRFEGQRRLVETFVQQDRIEEAEVQARGSFETYEEAGMQV